MPVSLTSPMEVTNEEGKIAWSGKYDALGAVNSITLAFFSEPDRSPKDFEQNLRFAGQYFDKETGLHFNTYRFYAPETGRFISPDPIGLRGGLNVYAYAPNPIGWIDPWGLSRCGSASGQLPELRGKSVNQVEKTLENGGFSQTKVSNSAAKNQTWSYPDGSEVRIHPYGNESMNMKNGQVTPKSGLNAHVHKENPAGNQLDDLGNVSRDPNLTHIGTKNPADYPTVRGRPHGSGR